MGILDGKCFYCGGEVKGRGLWTHFQRHVWEMKTGEDAFLILAKGKPYWMSGSDPFWMVFAARKDLTLKDLDRFLRDVWVECCGHMSAFKIRSTYYYSHPGPDDRSMDVPLSEVLRPNSDFRYEYDFGTPTYVSLYVLGSIKAPLRRDGISIVGQNDPPTFTCEVCGQRPAKYFHIYREEFICEECYDADEMEDEVLPVVNSPRLGVCAYEGPAIDPKEYRIVKL